LRTQEVFGRLQVVDFICQAPSVAIAFLAIEPPDARDHLRRLWP